MQKAHRMCVCVAVLTACAGSAMAWQPAKAVPVTEGKQPPLGPGSLTPSRQPTTPTKVPPQNVKGQPDAPPAALTQEGPLPTITGDDPDMVTLSALSEPVNMATLIELVATTLDINITIIGDVPGSVKFNAPVPVKKADLMSLLRSLLEQQSWTITQDRFGLYTVSAVAQVTPNLGGEMSSTRVFRTPNMRPTSLKLAIEGQVGPPGPGPGGARQYAYIDDLGIIVATDTPGKLDAIGQVLGAIIAESLESEFARLPLEHISAAVARERALQLIGMAQPAAAASPTNRGNAPGGGGDQATARNLSTLYSLSERLSVDQQGNALIFRGTADEAEQVKRVVAVIDIPNELVPRTYKAGRSASQVADIGHGRGLGEVITIEDLSFMSSAGGLGFPQNRDLSKGQPGVTTGGTTIVGGPLMVVDQSRGQIIYYGTDSQQSQLKALLDQLDTQAEAIVTRVYKLKNARAIDLSDIINGLISGTGPVASAPLLPGDSGGSGRRSNSPRGLSTPRPSTPRPTGTPQSGDDVSIDGLGAFVYPDEKNNQLLVKAQAGVQPEFARLIEKLDLRRPQVYIEAKIVAVTTDDKLRTAFESQLINAAGTGGVFTQGFGLATYAATGILTPPAVNPFRGFTGAVIRNDMVPIVMTALANETDSRIISNPQLLVDDNEEAEVVSLDEQPTTTLSRGSLGGSGDIVTQGQSATAGTTLNVKPQISGGGHLRLEYNIELSSFTGQGEVIGGTRLSPPKQTNTITASSVTIPSDYTIVVGGLVVDAKSKTVAKIPLLGDIPLLGLLFQDRSSGNRKTVLYVFLTPKILRDPTFNDLKLLTRGPQDRVNLDLDVPDLVPSTAEIVAPDAPNNVPNLTPVPVPAPPAEGATTSATPSREPSEWPNPD